VDGEAHWNEVYLTKGPGTLSWYQPYPETSLRLIRQVSDKSARVVDVGAGASELVDALLDGGFQRPVVLDISAAALELAQRRLGVRAALVEWVVADVTRAPALPQVHLWHDRAVLHFLTDPAHQQAYARLAAARVIPGGHAVIATFALDGPERCSGLPVQRHDGRSVASLFGQAFKLFAEEHIVHDTPSGSQQRFCWTTLRRE